MRKEDQRRQQVHQAELQTLRESLGAERDEALLKQEAERNREREKLRKQVADLQRKLTLRTAHQLGDSAEVDLFEALRSAFPEDRISRIGRGQPGADILHEVMHNGACAGSIVLDSKNRRAWQTAFVGKLRSDQARAKAEHAILSTSALPVGEKDFCIRNNVIVASPTRVVVLVRLLRASIIKVHRLGLGEKERATRLQLLYNFVQGAQYRHSIEEIISLINELQCLETKEQAQHQATWKARARLMSRQQAVVTEIDAGVSSILEGPIDPGP